MVFILYKPYVLLPYTNPTPNASPYRKLSAFLLSPKNSFCINYKRFEIWGHVLINHLLLVIPVIPMSLYKCMSSYVTKTHTYVCVCVCVCVCANRCNKILKSKVSMQLISNTVSRGILLDIHFFQNAYTQFLKLWLNFSKLYTQNHKTHTQHTKHHTHLAKANTSLKNVLTLLKMVFLHSNSTHKHKIISHIGLHAKLHTDVKNVKHYFRVSFAQEFVTALTHTVHAYAYIH